MKAKIRQARRRQRILSKLFKRALWIGGLAMLAGWAILHYSEIQLFLDRFRPNISTVEVDRYYELLSEHKEAAEELVYDLGVRDSESLDKVLFEMKKRMNLGREHILLKFDSEDPRPAYVEMSGNDSTIYVSTKLASRREQINVLVHELGHIYVSRLKEKIFGSFDQERLVDTAGIFLGFGIYVLNGFTNDYHVMADGSYQTNQKTFGYLEAEQFGYLTARFCEERGIPEERIKPYLLEAGFKYYKAGRQYLEKKSGVRPVPPWIFKAQTRLRAALEKAGILAGQVRHALNTKFNLNF